MRARKLSPVLLLSVFTSPPAAQAASFDWICANSYYDASSCWNPTGVPTTGDRANVVTVGGADTFLTIDVFIGHENVGILNIDATAGTQVRFRIDSGGVPGTASLTSNLNVWVGSSGSGNAELVVENGGSISDLFGIIGVAAGSAGAATVSGTGSQWISSEELFVGQFGNGTLNVLAGGTVSNTSGNIAYSPGSTGTATVTGAGATWTNTTSLYIGGGIALAGGTGALTVGNGGTVDVANTLKLWSDGTLTLDGGTVRVNTLDLSLGTLVFNSGTLNFSNNLNIGSAGPLGSAVTVESNQILAADGDLIIEPGAMMTINGGEVTSTNGVIASGLGAGSAATVTGPGSQWINTDNITVGNAGTGTLIIAAGGRVSNADAFVGRPSGSMSSVTVTGMGSQWVNTGIVSIGDNSTLNVEDQGEVLASAGFIGEAGTATVTGTGSAWTVNKEMVAGFLSGTGTLAVVDGGVVSNGDGIIGAEGGTAGTVTVTGIGSHWASTGSLTVGDGGNGTLTVEAGGTVSNVAAVIGRAGVSTGIANVTGMGSQWSSTSSLTVGNFGNATLNVEDGGVVSNASSIIAFLIGSIGTTTVTGPGSQWNTGDLAVAFSGSGTMNIEAGGTVLTSGGGIGINNGSTGTVNVTGPGSQWNTTSLTISSDAFVGGGSGTLNVDPGGTVNVATALTLWENGTVNLNGGTINAADVVMAGSSFNFSAGALNIGNNLDIRAGGPLGSSFSLTQLHELSVGDTTTLDPFSTLSLDGGTFATGALVNNAGFFNFNSGTFNLTNSTLTVGPGGVLGAMLQLDHDQVVIASNGITIDPGSVVVLNNGTLNGGTVINNGEVILAGPLAKLAGGTVMNHNRISGEGRVTAALANAAGGRVDIGNGEEIRFTAAGNTNGGDIDNVGGTIVLEQDLTNDTGGLIRGRGTFRTEGGLNNSGNVAFSGGTSDVFGDIDNLAGASILISGNATVTFWDDLVHNGAEIRVSSGSNAIFFGAVSGTGPYTGTGSSFFEGDLNPGNSPGLMTIGGDVGFGATNTLTIELADGAQDQLLVGGELKLGGALEIVLLDLFEPEDGTSWTIVSATGGISGGFDQLVVPAMAGTDFLLDYRANALVLSVAAVPLPAGLWLLLSGLAVLLHRRRAKR